MQSADIPRTGITRPGLTEMQNGAMLIWYGWITGVVCGLIAGIIVTVIAGLGLAAWYRGS